MGRKRTCAHPLEGENLDPWWLSRGYKRCLTCRRERARTYDRTHKTEIRERKVGKLDRINAWPGGPRLVACLGPGCRTKKFLSRSKAVRLCNECRVIVASADALGLGIGDTRDMEARDDLKQLGGRWAEKLRHLSTRQGLDFRRHTDDGTRTWE